MEVFIGKMQAARRKEIDFNWRSLESHCKGMAEYIKYLFKTVRKYFGETIVVT